MTKEMTELIVNIVVNTMDIAMIYCLCCNLIEKRVLLSVKSISLGLLCGFILGFAANYLDNYLFRLLSFIVIITLLVLVSRKKIYDALILYAIILYICLLIIQLPLAIVLNSISMGEIHMALIGQTITLFFAILVYKKIPLYKLLNIVEKEILLKLFFFILFGILCSMIFYFNLEVSDFKFYILYFSVLLLISLVGLYKTVNKIFFYTNKVPVILDDMKNAMTGMYITVNGEVDINVIRHDLNKYFELIVPGVDVHEIVVKEYEKNIISFIEHKKLQSSKKLIFNSEVYYGKHNTKFPFPTIIYILGLLLDNAIEATETDKPIYIKIFVTENILNISVANKYEKKSPDDIDKMFQEGYSTKSEELGQKRGYGLSNLSKIVTKHGGDILIEYSYNEEYKSTYLTITIDLSKVKQKELLGG